MAEQFNRSHPGPEANGHRGPADPCLKDGRFSDVGRVQAQSTAASGGYHSWRLLNLRGPSRLRAVTGYQLEYLTRTRLPRGKTETSLLRIRSTRCIVTGRRTLLGSAPAPAQFYKIARRDLIGTIGRAMSRAIMRTHVGRRIAHATEKNKRAVVRTAQGEQSLGPGRNGRSMAIDVRCGRRPLLAFRSTLPLTERPHHICETGAYGNLPGEAARGWIGIFRVVSWKQACCIRDWLRRPAARMKSFKSVPLQRPTSRRCLLIGIAA